MVQAGIFSQAGPRTWAGDSAWGGWRITPTMETAQHPPCRLPSHTGSRTTFTL